MRELPVKPWYQNMTSLEEFALDDFVDNIWEGGDFAASFEETIHTLKERLSHRGMHVCTPPVELIERNIILAAGGEPQAFLALPGSAGERLSDENLGYLLIYYSVSGGETEAESELTFPKRMDHFFNLISADADADELLWSDDGSCQLKV